MDLSLLQNDELLRVDDPPAPWSPQYTYSVTLFCEPYERIVATDSSLHLKDSASTLIEASEELKGIFPNVRLALHIFGADLSNFQRCSVPIGTTEVVFERRIGMLTEMLVQHHPSGCVSVCTAIVVDHCTGYQYIFVLPPKAGDGSDIDRKEGSETDFAQRLFMDRFTRVKEPVPMPDPDEISSARLQSETMEGLENLIGEMERWAQEKGLQILHKSYNRNNTVVDVYFHMQIKRSVLRNMLAVKGRGGGEDDEIEYEGHVDAERGLAAYILERYLKRYAARLQISKSIISWVQIQRICACVAAQKRWGRRRGAGQLVVSCVLRWLWVKELGFLRSALKLLQGTLRRRLPKYGGKFRRGKALAINLSRFFKRSGVRHMWNEEWFWRSGNVSAITIQAQIRRNFLRNKLTTRRRASVEIQKHLRRTLTIKRAASRWLIIEAGEVLMGLINIATRSVDERRLSAALVLQASGRRASRNRIYSRYKNTSLPRRFELRYVTARVGWWYCRRAIHTIVAACATAIARRSYVAEQVLLRLANNDQLQRRLLVRVMLGAKFGMGPPASLSDFCISLLHATVETSPLLRRNCYQSIWRTRQLAAGRLQARIRTVLHLEKEESRTVLRIYALAWVNHHTYRVSLRLLRRLETASVAHPAPIASKGLKLPISNPPVVISESSLKPLVNKVKMQSLPPSPIHTERTPTRFENVLNMFGSNGSRQKQPLAATFDDQRRFSSPSMFPALAVQNAFDSSSTQSRSTSQDPIVLPRIV